jgi:hypothetical protein
MRDKCKQKDKEIMTNVRHAGEGDLIWSEWRASVKRKLTRPWLTNTIFFFKKKKKKKTQLDPRLVPSRCVYIYIYIYIY